MGSPDTVVTLLSQVFAVRMSLTHSNPAQSHWGPGSQLVVKMYLLSLSSFEHYRVVKAKEITSPIFEKGKQRQALGCKNTVFCGTCCVWFLWAFKIAETAQGATQRTYLRNKSVLL